MNYYLDKNKIEYILYHLNLIIDLVQPIKKNMVFPKSDKNLDKFKNKIIFPLSNKNFDIKKVKWKKNIPILFPINPNRPIYEFKNSNLIFNDDLIKSSFYLLSGYQEYISDISDQYGRFPYKESIQYKIDITRKPIVNYYFEFIKEGIKKYCKKYSINFKEKNLFTNFGFLLTHDIDRIKFYKFYRVKLVLKKLMGLTESDFSLKYNFFKFLRVIFYWIFGNNKKDPYWNFQFLRQIEKKYNINSVFYFLHQDQKDIDSYYHFRSDDFKKIIHYLTKENCEIGLHGSAASVNSLKKMHSHLKELSRVSKHPIVGIRQHRLKYDILKTPLIQNQLGFKYDTTLGFAEHEGFRNSFCLPFKIFDHNNDEMLDLWEFPLNVMDVTLFFYRQYNFNQAYKSIEKLIKEIRKFNGLFVLLWHNKRFNEEQIPGFTQFYKNLISKIMNKKPINILGKELVSLLKNII